MPALELFPADQIVGVFRGFQHGGLEFHADLVLPYRNEFQNLPMHGQFLLIQLETPDEAVLGRITSFSSEGKLSSGTGEEFNIRALREDREIPEDLREQYLKYRVNIRVLGVLRKSADDRLIFVASHRRLPHVGSKVAFPSADVLKEIAGHNDEAGAALGHFALGEFIYSGQSTKIDRAGWMQVKSPEVLVKFPISSLVSRRSFILARAGFGKSNLNKLLFSKLYEETPTVRKRSGNVPVGTIIFDPDGEYFWPDDKGRPGLCDVPHLTDKLVVFTSRQGPSSFYQSFVAGGIKLDIRRLRPGDVIAIALPPERQDQQNIRKLKGLDAARWQQLVNIIDAEGNNAPLEEIQDLLQLAEGQQVEALAARANMTQIVRMLHDKSSQLMDLLIEALSQGKLCIVDVSQMRGGQSLILSGLILRRIFDKNQEEFTAAEPKTIPTIAVVEEAQSVLNENATSAEPYISWVKEGRKYDLGAVLVTQQPGSIPMEILSQGDNWFIFHLLSAGDLANVKRANAHFSEDLLSSLLNEPIPGQGVFWSSVSGKPYPVSTRVLSFEKMYELQDPMYAKAEITTYASSLRKKIQSEIEDNVVEVVNVGTARANGDSPAVAIADLPPVSKSDGEESADVMETLESRGIEALRADTNLINRIKDDGVAWGSLKAFFEEKLPKSLDDRGNFAFNLVQKAMNAIFGRQNEGWHSYPVVKDGGRKVWYVKAGRKS
ncbi:MAG: ATP-binding protein [Pyrinomonadaceae bacterium]